MQIVLFEIHDFSPGRVLDVSIENVPLFRNGPIKHFRACRHLAYLQWYQLTKYGERLAHALSRYRAADRKEALQKRTHLAFEHLVISGIFHAFSLKCSR